MNKSNNKWALIFGILCLMAGEIYSQILPPACTPSPGVFTQKPCVGVTDVMTQALFCVGDSYVWTVNNATYTAAGTYTFPSTDVNGCEYNEVLVLAADASGCTDPLADNYDPNAVCDDGSCTLLLLGCICGNTWIDANLNGVQDPGEQAVAGLDISLIDLQGTTIASTQTDASGSYCFNGLPDGSYRVHFELILGGFYTSKDVSNNSFDTVDSDAASTGLTDPIILNGGNCDSNTDAGYNFAD